jgi:hypothetical protein
MCDVSICTNFIQIFINENLPNERNDCMYNYPISVIVTQTDLTYIEYTNHFCH